MGGGFGSAFHLKLASYRRVPGEAAAAANKILRFDGSVGVATALFQLAGGMLLARHLGLSLASGWLAAALTLYIVALLIWVPVVALEFRMRRLAREADHGEERLPRDYWRAFFAWLGLGASGFLCFAGIIWLMLYKKLPFIEG